MKTKTATAKFKFLFAALIILTSFLSVFSQNGEPFSINNSPLPAPTGFVNDYAGVLDANTKQQLEQKITDFKNKTNPPVELAVAIVKTTGERDIFDYSLAVSRGWKIGSKQDDNPSALLFIAIDDRKYFTQVSKDLEDELPDGLVGSLQRQYLVPAFRQGNYSKGVADTIDAYIKTIEAKQTGTAPPVAGQPKTNTGKKGGLSIGGIICCIGIILLLLMVFRSFGRRKDKNDRDRWGGGGGFGGGGALPWIIGSIIANSSSSSSGSSGGWGGSSDSGSSWGGFGGGGDFGGGGAGGDW